MNRAQNCLTVSNIKLDDVFSDVFGKATTAITTRLLENPSEKITDVSQFKTKGMKATDEEVPAAVGGEICPQQAEKLCIIRSHMSSLELCKANSESLILTTAEKHLPQLNLVATAPGIQSFSAIALISEVDVDMSVFPTSKHLCSWRALRRRTTKATGRRKPPESAGLALTSSLYSSSVPLALSVPNSSPKCGTVIWLSRTAGDTRKLLLPLPECSSRLFTTYLRRTNHIIRISIARRTVHPNTVKFQSDRLFLSCSAKAIW